MTSPSGGDDRKDEDRFSKLFEGGQSALLGRMAEDTPGAGEVREAAPPPHDLNQKMIDKKTLWAAQGHRLTGEVADKRSRRLPPGQTLTRGLPLLEIGHRPLIPPDQWELSVSGLVERPLKLNWRQFRDQPRAKIVVDIHCVTAWSSYDVSWEGMATRHLLSLVKPKPEAKFVIFHGHDGYRTNLPMAHFDVADGLIADGLNGGLLDRDHGGPARVVIPHLYFWKSAKWIRQITFLEADAPGYWETRGYHAIGDPWREERYGSSGA